jgi:predicted nuclease of predicted toxin-antitoxin system
LPPDAAPDEPIFFVDRSLGGKLVVQALRDAGARIIVHDDVLPQDTKDVEWLAEAGRRNWIVLTKDSAIRRNPHEKSMFRDAGVRVFALARKDLSGQEMAEIFANALEGMRKRAMTIEPPFIFSISRNGDFRRLD